MIFKLSDILKIEIFAPGTAGERAIRVETEDGVEIFDQEKFAELEIKESPKPSSYLFLQKSDDKILGKIEFLNDSSLDWLERVEDYDFEAESFEEGWQKGIDFLKQNNLPHPEMKDLLISEEDGWIISYWESDNLEI